jgi:creatinine amidohydrolase/Fe(II)-dependent formamide hydrolase-like protein
MGDPSPATPEKGEQWSNEAATRIAEVLVAMFQFEPRHGA